MAWAQPRAQPPSTAAWGPRVLDHSDRAPRPRPPASRWLFWRPPAPPGPVRPSAAWALGSGGGGRFCGSVERASGTSLGWHSPRFVPGRGQGQVGVLARPRWCLGHREFCATGHRESLRPSWALRTWPASRAPALGPEETLRPSARGARSQLGAYIVCSPGPGWGKPGPSALVSWGGHDRTAGRPDTRARPPVRSWSPSRVPGPVPRGRSPWGTDRALSLCPLRVSVHFKRTPVRSGQGHPGEPIYLNPLTRSHTLRTRAQGFSVWI